MIEQAHHPSGFSSKGREALCPASRKEGAMAISSNGSDGATRGTRLHGSWQTGDRTGLSPYDSGQVDRVDEHFREKVAAIGQKIQSEHVEERFFLHYPNGRKEFGHPDRVVRFETGALIADAKFHPTGHIEETLTAWELLTAAVAVLQRWPELKAVKAYAFAPASGTEYPLTVRKADLKGHLEELARIDAACEAEDPAYRPGAEQCKYCPARATCPALRALVKRPPEGAELEKLVRETPQGFEILDPRGLAEQTELAKMGKAHCEAFLDLVRSAVISTENGETEFQTLRNSGSDKTIRDPEKVRDTLPPEVLDALKRTFSFGDVKKAVEAAYGLKGKEAERRTIELIGDEFHLKPRKPSVQLKKGIAL